MRRRLLFAAALVLVGCMVAHAQIAVFDPAVTTRNSVTAALKAYLVSLQTEQRRQLRRMARRLSVFTNLDKYGSPDPDPPRWRIHVFFDAPEEPVLFARDYHAALNYGEVNRTGFVGGPIR